VEIIAVQWRLRADGGGIAHLVHNDGSGPRIISLHFNTPGELPLGIGDVIEADGRQEGEKALDPSRSSVPGVIY
jgi:hypothetical protein